MFNLWTDEDIIVRNVNGKEIKCLNLEATRRVYAYVAGTETSDKKGNLPLETAIKVLSQLKPKEEVKPAETATEDGLPVEEEVKEEPKRFIIKEKYRDLIEYILDNYDEKITVEQLKEAVIKNAAYFPHHLYQDELGEQIKGALIDKYGLSSLTIVEIQRALTRVKNYFENLTDEDNKIFDYISTGVMKGNLADFLKFVELNLSNDKYEEYKTYLYVYVMSSFINKNSEIYCKEFGSDYLFTLTVLDNIKKYSKRLYNILVDSLDEEFKKDFVIEKESVDLDDKYSIRDIERINTSYEKFLKELKKENGSFDPDDELIDEAAEEVSKPRKFSNPFADDSERVEPQPRKFRNPFEVKDDEDESELTDEDEEEYTIIRKGNITKDEKFAKILAFASGILLVIIAGFGVNPKTAWFEKQYGGFGSFSYTTIMAAFVLSTIYKSAKNKVLGLINKDDLDLIADDLEDDEISTDTDELGSGDDDVFGFDDSETETRKFRRFNPAEDEETTEKGRQKRL